jgi:hypothetical protein
MSASQSRDTIQESHREWGYGKLASKRVSKVDG